jgi:hypothetical protein
MNTATALPAEVQLGKEKPQGAFALRSRYALSANSASSWNAGTTLSLPLQTGTPGTFTDVKQGVIQCTLQIINTNPYVDFLNFGPSGSMIFFDEMRIYSSGTPVEENLRYSETADLLTIQGGHQCRPFQLYRRNKWRAANGLAGDKHVNFVKPSMVDSCGVPMFGLTPFMDKNSAVYHPATISFGSRDNAVANSIYYSTTTNKGATASFGPMGVGDTGGSFDDSGLDRSVAVNGVGYQTNSSRLHRSPDFVDFDLLTGPTLTAQQFATTQSSTFPPTSAQLAVATWLPNAFHAPSEWPNYQPSTLCGEFDDEEVDTIMGKAKVSEYMKYLCNVRCLPIGVQGNVSPNGYHRNSDVALAPAAQEMSTIPARRFVEYRVSMPFLSGIYGIFAEKMFPDMLIGANNIRIEFKLAQNSKALWTSMDPCRRVPGTLRDFTPFTGTKSGVNRKQSLIARVGTAAYNFAIDPAAAALGCTNAAVNFANTDVDIASSQDTNKHVSYSEMYTSAAAMGEDVVIPSFLVNYPGQTVAGVAFGALTTPSIKLSLLYDDSMSISGKSNLPKPQYVPCSAPWSSKESNVVTYVNENAACYGTYLPASQAQSRRCWLNTKLEAKSDLFSNAGQVSYTIRDIQYVGEQVQLDDVVTSAIIQSAASSEIVVWTRGYRSFEASCDQNTSQNIILPIQIGMAEAMYLIFRPPIILNSYDYYANSFYNVFTGLSFTGTLPDPSSAGTSINYDVGGAYRLESSLDTASSGAFSYQLFSGTKQYPLQPIQTVTELLVEREKSQHNLHNWGMCSTENMSIVQWGSKFGNSTNATGLDFDPFMDFGYFTTFVSVFALDDQTITQNPYLQIVEANENSADGSAYPRIRGKRCPSSLAASADRAITWNGVLNEFLSPIGSFYLGWDFESWTNHQDVMRTGKFLGQEQLTIRMTGTHLCTASNVIAVGQAAQRQNIMCTAIVPHVVKMSFVPGGHMLTYY